MLSSQQQQQQQQEQPPRIRKAQSSDSLKVANSKNRSRADAVGVGSALRRSSPSLNIDLQKQPNSFYAPQFLLPPQQQYSPPPLPRLLPNGQLLPLTPRPTQTQPLSPRSVTTGARLSKLLNKSTQMTHDSIKELDMLQTYAREDDDAFGRRLRELDQMYKQQDPNKVQQVEAQFNGGLRTANHTDPMATVVPETRKTASGSVNNKRKFQTARVDRTERKPSGVVIAPIKKILDAGEKLCKKPDALYVHIRQDLYRDEDCFCFVCEQAFESASQQQDSSSCSSMSISSTSGGGGGGGGDQSGCAAKFYVHQMCCTEVLEQSGDTGETERYYVYRTVKFCLQCFHRHNNGAGGGQGVKIVPITARAELLYDI
jgi:hypothetical protein